MSYAMMMEVAEFFKYDVQLYYNEPCMIILLYDNM